MEDILARSVHISVEIFRIYPRTFPEIRAFWVDLTYQHGRLFISSPYLCSFNPPEFGRDGDMYVYDSILRRYTLTLYTHCPYDILYICIYILHMHKLYNIIYPINM